MNMQELADAINTNMRSIEKAVNLTDNYLEYGSVIITEYEEKEAIAICDDGNPIVYIAKLTDEEMYYAGIDPSRSYSFMVYSARDEELQGVIDATDEESLLYTFLYPFFYVNVLDNEMSKLNIKNVSKNTEKQAEKE